MQKISNPVSKKQNILKWRFDFQMLKMLLAAIYLKYEIKMPENNFDITIKRTTIRPQNITKARFAPISF